jgi:hypothetical protein
VRFCADSVALLSPFCCRMSLSHNGFDSPRLHHMCTNRSRTLRHGFRTQAAR